MYFEPKAFRTAGPVLWLGGAGMHARMIDRVVRYGNGLNPLGRPTARQLERLQAAMLAAGRDMSSLELVGGAQ